MKSLPIGIQTFSELVDPQLNYVYIDKTAIFHKLITSGKYYFLSRPRRFGKSVMISTLAEIFAGNQALFKGLAIEPVWPWDKPSPVLRISFGGGEFKNEAQFDRVLFDNLRHNQRRLGVDCEEVEDPSSCFRELIINTCEQYQQKVAILIDEYDKPILDHIIDKPLARANRDKLKGFYGVMKDLDPYIRFVMITGVSKFAKVNLFSGLNNIEDISVDARFSTICGYTHQEVEEAFGDFLPGVDREKLKRWYNGYNYLGEPIYNPFDILLFFAKGKEYRNYWWGTGNPSFLIDKLKEQTYYLPDLQNFVADDMLLDSFDVDHIDLVALLWQTGYLTFAEKFSRRGEVAYRLKVPNREVQGALNNLFIDYLTNQRQERLRLQDNLYDALEAGEMEQFKQVLNTLFAAIPYNNYANNIIARYEGYYASVVYAYLASLGLPMIAEDVTSKGRIDLTLHLPNHSIIIEFKVDSEEEPLAQIKRNNYADKYRDGRKITLVGISFDSSEKQIATIASETLGH
jgi:hypothetical protein